MITVRPDPGSRSKLNYRLGMFKSGVPKAEARAANVAAKRVRTLISKVIRDRVSIKKKDVDKEIWIRLANPKAPRPSARVTLSKKPRLPLKWFGARQTKQGVTYRIAKGGKRELVPGAFGPRIGRLGGHVFVREFADGPSKSKRRKKRIKGSAKATARLARRVHRKPIRKQRGVSAWGVFVKNDLLPEILDESRDLMQRELVRQIDLLKRGVIK